MSTLPPQYIFRFAAEEIPGHRTPNSLEQISSTQPSEPDRTRNAIHGANPNDKSLIPKKKKAHGK